MCLMVGTEAANRKVGECGTIEHRSVCCFIGSRCGCPRFHRKRVRSDSRDVPGRGDKLEHTSIPKLLGSIERERGRGRGRGRGRPRRALLRPQTRATKNRVDRSGLSVVRTLRASIWRVAEAWSERSAGGSESDKAPLFGFTSFPPSKTWSQPNRDELNVWEVDELIAVGSAKPVSFHLDARHFTFFFPYSASVIGGEAESENPIRDRR